MGLATIDLHSQKEHTEIHKISNFGVNQTSFDGSPQNADHADCGLQTADRADHADCADRAD